MKYQDDLRFKMIALAIRDNDFEMLSDLHAREIPLLYTINPIQHWTLKDKQLPSSSNVEQMINSIAASKTLLFHTSLKNLIQQNLTHYEAHLSFHTSVKYWML